MEHALQELPTWRIAAHALMTGVRASRRAQYLTANNTGLESRDVADLDTARRMRAFNRFYTEAIGSLHEQHEGLDVTLAQSRMLFTVASIDQPQVGQIAEVMRLDLAYTSRLLGSLEDAGLIRRSVSRHDRRQRDVVLSAKGRRLLAEIEDRSNERMTTLVSHLDDDEIERLLEAMNTIRELLDKEHR